MTFYTLLTLYIIQHGYINRFYWLIALCLIISTGANASVNPKPFVIPELKEWKGSDGAFVPTEATKIVYAANNPELERIALNLCPRLSNNVRTFARSSARERSCRRLYLFPPAPTRN